MKMNRLAESVVFVALVAIITTGLLHFSPPGSGDQSAPAQQQKAAEVASGSTEIVELAMGNFDKEINKATRPVYILICSEGRAACRLQTPVVEKLAGEYKGSVTFAHVDLGKEPQLAKSLGLESLNNVPAHFLVKSGNPVVGMPGYLDETELKIVIDRGLKIEPKSKSN